MDGRFPDADSTIYAKMGPDLVIFGFFWTRIPEEQTSSTKQYFYEHVITSKININETIQTLHVC